MADGRVEFEITADGRKAYASIDQVTDELKKAGIKWESNAKQATDQIGNSFSGMLKKIVAGISAAAIGKAILNIGKEAIQAASDLEEVQNVVDVTFGEAGAVKIEKWAQEAGKQFGLTETQAKKFTSTLGAMMKSAGMSGDQIVEMSTDLSGLAADMASFYNLDFDTAFQKIRSGISGETEPLKQLGINMSEANLQAFALQQGLTKTFGEMTQGEKTILRYQYLMQATSDAQGDFARTSDGYANAMRMVETNIESLKTKLGSALLPVINDVIGGINEMFDKLTGQHEATVLDDFANIDLKTAEKIAKIEQTANSARDLVAVLENAKTASGEILDNVPDGKTGKLSELKGNLEKIETQAGADKESVGAILDDVPNGDNTELRKLKTNLEDIQSKAGSAKISVENISTEAGTAQAAVQKIPAGKYDSEGSFIGDVKADIKHVSEDAETAKADVEAIPSGHYVDKNDFIHEVQAEVGDIGAKAKTAKDDVKKITSEAPSGESLKPLKQAVEGIQEGAQAAASAISLMTAPAEQANEADSLWLETCKELVATLPGLGSIIDTQTGEIKGGTQAVYDYIDAWEQAQKGMVLRSAHEQKRGALEAKAAELPGLELNKTVAEYRLKKQQDAMTELLSSYGLDPTKDYRMNAGSAKAAELGLTDEMVKNINEQADALNRAKNEASEARKAYQEQKDAYDEAAQAYKEEGEIIEATYAAAIEAVGEWSDAQKEAAMQMVSNLDEALKAMKEYEESVRTATKEQIDGNIGGFKQMKTAKQQAEEAANAYKELADSLKEAGVSGKEFDSKMDAANKQITAQSMKQALQSQIDYINEYKENLKTLQELTDENGGQIIDPKILAELSDGSEESSQYLHAMAEAARSGDKETLKQLNEMWGQVNEGKESFVDTLTQQKLAVDEQYDAMVKKAEEAAKALDVSSTAGESTGNNIQAMADAIKEHVPEVAEQVDAVLAELNRLSDWGINFGLDGFGIAGSVPLDGSHETGLNFVPFDGYLAQLHEGEGILTAEENRVWQAFKNGQRGVDYETLGGVMRDSIKPGGNVYLDGRQVGQVVSDMQGNQYRTMQRSGFQQ